MPADRVVPHHLTFQGPDCTALSFTGSPTTPTCGRTRDGRRRPPAFGSHLDLDGIARGHHAHRRGREAAGTAVRIVDWAAYARREEPEPVRQPG